VQYNTYFPTPLNPAATLQAQASAGIYTGTIAAGAGGGFATLESNNFVSSGAIVYTVTPSVSAMSSLAGTNAAIGISSVTTSNVVFTVSSTNQTLYWTATGH